MPKELREAACGTREGGEAAAERLDCPVGTSMMGLSAIPASSHRKLGMVGMRLVLLCVCVCACACSHTGAVHRMCTGWNASSLHLKSKCTEGLENSDPKVTSLGVLWRQRLSLIYLCDPESLGSGLSWFPGNGVWVSGGEDCPSWDGILQRGSLWAHGPSGD